MLKISDAPYCVVIMGDSVAKGLGASTIEQSFSHKLMQHIKTHRPNAVLHNFGTGGAKVQQVLSQQLPQLKNLHPNLVIVIAGGNDVLKQTTLHSFDQGVHELVTHLSHLPCRVIVFNVANMGLLPLIPRALRPILERRSIRFNEIYTDVTHLYPNIHLYNFFDLSQKHLTSGKNMLSRDRFHPNDESYALIAEEAWDIVALS